MPLSVFFAFWAYYLLDHPQRERTYVLSALALGMGIGLRSWPVLLLPFLLRPGQLKWRQRVLYLFVASLPSVLTLAPYLMVNFTDIRREVFEYKSVADLGWVGASRAYYFLQTGSREFPRWGVWLSNSRFYFLEAYGVVVLAAWLVPALLDTAGLDRDGVAAELHRDGRHGRAVLLLGVAVPDRSPSLLRGVLAGGDRRPDHVLPGTASGNRARTVPAALQLHAAAGLRVELGFPDRDVGGRGRMGVVGRADGSSAAGGLRRCRRLRVAAGALAMGEVVHARAAGVAPARWLSNFPSSHDSRPPAELRVDVEWSAAGRGPELGHFEGPIGLAVHPSGDIYVVDLGYRRVQRFDSSGKFLSTWETEGDAPLQLWQPSDVAIGSDGTVYVLDASAKMYRLTPDGSLQLAVDLVPHGASNPRALTIDESRHRFYIADAGRGRVLVLGTDGSFIDAWGGPDTALSFFEPAGIALDSHGNVFVAEPANSRIRKLGPDGTLLAEWKAKGVLFDIAVGPDDRVYVSSADRGGYGSTTMTGRFWARRTVPSAQRTCRRRVPSRSPATSCWPLNLHS